VDALAANPVAKDGGQAPPPPLQVVTVTGQPTAVAQAEPSSAAGPLSIDERIKQIRTRLAQAKLDDKGQAELCRLAGVLDELVHQRVYTLLGNLELAASLLLAEAPQTLAVAGILTNLERALGGSALARLLRRNTANGNVALGLATLVLGMAAGVTWLVAPNLKPGVTLANMDATLLVLVGLTGALGSVVSVMYRIDQFTDDSSSGPLRLFFTGLFKPIIGVGFALFVFAALSAKLTPLLQPAPGTEAYFFAAIGFLAGFVEKFAPDLINTVDAAVEGGKGSAPTVTSANSSTRSVTTNTP
jgi:hypothetical protein